MTPGNPQREPVPPVTGTPKQPPPASGIKTATGTSSTVSSNYPPPPAKEPNKDGIMVDNASKWQAWCKETGGIPYPCERGKPLSSMRNKGYVPVERMNNKPGTNEDSRLPGLPLGSNNICCWRKILPP